MDKFIVVDLEDCSNSLASNDFMSVAHHSVSTQTRVHYHKCCELEILVDGKVDLQINDLVASVEKGAFWLSFRNDIHFLSPKSENARIISIKFIENAFPEAVFSQFSLLQNSFLGSIKADLVDALSLDIERFCSAFSNFTSKSSQSIFASGFLTTLLAYLSDFVCSSNSSSLQTENCSSVIYSCIAYIKSHFKEKITVSSVAHKFGYAPNYLSYLFKHEVGKSFTDFLLAERMHFAYYLLSTSSFSISEIAEYSGFESASYFSRKFKVFYGVTPANIRNGVE